MQIFHTQKENAGMGSIQNNTLLNKSNTRLILSLSKKQMILKKKEKHTSY